MLSAGFIVYWILAIHSLSPTSAEEYFIKTTWNNQTIDHIATPMHIELSKNGTNAFNIIVKAPFFNSPVGPPDVPTPPGEPLFGLWDLELVKVFFANDKNEYVEIELGAWGHHFVLLLNGYRQTIRFGMVLDYSATRVGNEWHGAAVIPSNFLPPRVSTMNIFAFRGSGSTRITEALYPVSFKPNITLDEYSHNLASFQPFDSKIIQSDDSESFSSVWMDSLHGIRSFHISHTWNGTSLEANETVHLNIGFDPTLTSLILNVSAPFYNDPVPNKPGGGSYVWLFTHEVVHLYLLSFPDLRYVEIQLGPWGHYLVAFWDGYYNHVGNYNSPIVYAARRTEERWTGTAAIPLAYLPPKVYLVNAFSGHGTGENRKANSLYPIPGGSNRTSPDFHLFQYYKFIDLSLLYPDNDSPVCSKIWQGMTSCPSSATDMPKMSFFTVFILVSTIYVT